MRRLRPQCRAHQTLSRACLLYTSGQIQSYEFLETSRIAQLVDDGSKLSVGFLIAIAAVILCGLFMYRTRWGYAIRMIGINQAFSK